MWWVRDLAVLLLRRLSKREESTGHLEWPPWEEVHPGPIPTTATSSRDWLDAS